METVRSPLTGGDDVVLLASYSVELLCSDWSRIYGIDVRSMFGSTDILRRYRCNESGLHFFSPATIEGTAEFYARLQKFPWYYPKDLWEFRMALRDLNRCARVLEVGCGSGHFLSAAKRSGMLVQGIEINPDAVSEARSRGLSVHLMDLGTAEDQFGADHDSVCCFQVLEHVRDPLGLMLGMAKLVRPNGSVIVTVPNQSGFMGRIYNLLDLPPHHATCWFPKTMRWIAKRTKLRLAKVQCEPLREDHVNTYVQAIGDNQLCGDWRGKHRVLRMINRLLHTRFRSCCKGHSLYAVFERPNAWCPLDATAT